MIVVASHDNLGVLEKLLSSMTSAEVKEDVCVVNTGSTDAEYVDGLSDLSARFDRLNIMILNGPPQYEAGAWVYAYLHTSADEYLFIHDSMVCNMSDPLRPFREKAESEELDVVSFREFHGLWGIHKELHDITEKAFGHRDVDTYKQIGVFGSIFYCKRAILDKIWEAGLLNDELLPFDKNTSMSWERFWPIIFQELDIKYGALGDHFRKYHNISQNPITKVFLNRQ